MNDWLSKLSSDPYFNLISAIAALIGIVTFPLSIYLYVRQKREKKPRFDYRRYEIIENLSSKIAGVQINYDGKPVENLTITKIAFWNSGRETIAASDIPSLDSLGVVFEPATDILDASIVYQSTEANNFSIVADKELKECRIEFDYIDHDDYVIFQILHTGPNTTFDFGGRVIGAGKIARSRLKRAEDQFFNWFVGGLVIWSIFPFSLLVLLKGFLSEGWRILAFIVLWFAGGMLIAKLFHIYIDKKSQWRSKFHKAFF